MFERIYHEFPRIKRTTNDQGIRVYQTPSGESYPSVTTVTGLLAKEAIKKWRERVGKKEAARISTTASKRGTRIHTLCEKYLSNIDFDETNFDLEMWESIRPHLDSINQIHALENKLYSDHLQVAGTVDCIAEYNGKLSVIDFKTSSKVKKREHIHGYFMQCSAYAVAFEEITKVPVSNLVIIMTVAHDDCIIFEEKRDDWIGQFKELREEYRRSYHC
tara:strand:- start:7557 stop:8210 length:654 start_codon:yes stop_codon:yes gene_type:complete